MCSRCRERPPEYPYHPECRDTLVLFLPGGKLTEAEYFLRFAQMMTSTLAVQQEALTPASLLNKYYSIVLKVLQLETPLPIAARALVGLQTLPAELREYVFRHMINSAGGCVLLRCGVIDALEALQKWPERRRQCISGNGLLFARWIGVRKTPHLAGLYKAWVKGSVKIKDGDRSWDCIVAHIDVHGITDVQFIQHSDLSHIRGTDSSIQVLQRSELTHDDLWLTLKVWAFPPTMFRLNFFSGLVHFANRLCLHKQQSHSMEIFCAPASTRVAIKALDKSGSRRVLFALS